MDTGHPGSPLQRAPALTRPLGILILLLMAGAAIYATSIALRYFRQIGV
jgi:hypothetical protein